MFAGVWEFVNDPFFIALFTALVLNGLTHRWADRKESVQVRTELVAAMSETATNAFLAGERVFGDSRVAARNGAARMANSDAEHQEELQQAARTWERDNAVIGTKLEAYFRSGGGEPNSETENYSGVELTSRAVEGANQSPIPIAWQRLGKALLSWLEGERTDLENWPPEQDRLKIAKAALIQRVLAEPIAVFREIWFPRLRAFLRLGSREKR